MDTQPSWNDLVLVGRVGRTHGIRGQVAVNAETDFAEERFTPGAVFWTRGGEAQLVIATARFQNGKPIVGFEGVTRQEDAEQLRGLELRVAADTLRPLDAGVYYHHQLEGCVVETVGGDRVGVVTRIEGGTGGSLLVADGGRGEVLIPLAKDICVDIDIAARRIVIDPPEGLLDVNERQERPERKERSNRSRRSKRSARAGAADSAASVESANALNDPDGNDASGNEPHGANGSSA